MAGIEESALKTMNDLHKEVVRMSHDIATLKYTSATGTVDRAKILALEEILNTIYGIARILADENERTQSALKHIHEVMENQIVVHTGVNLTTAEAIRLIFVSLTDLERVDG